MVQDRSMTPKNNPLMNNIVKSKFYNANKKAAALTPQARMSFEDD